MWSSLKQLITESINKHVPTKRTLARHILPWMNTRLRRLCKQKQRAYTKSTRTKVTKDWKANLQRESRQADTKFMQDKVSEDLHKNPKRIWSYIKSRKQESSGIRSLKNKDVYLQ